LSGARAFPGIGLRRRGGGTARAPPRPFPGARGAGTGRAVTAGRAGRWSRRALARGRTGRLPYAK
jgi:hypothetical protein